MVNQKLKDYFQFDEQDLEANQMGRMSDRQTALIGNEQAADKRNNWIVGIALVVVALLGLAFGWYKLTADHSVLWLWIGLVWAGGWGALAYFSGIKPATTVYPIKIQKAEGPVSIVKEVRQHTRSSGTHSDYSVCELHVDGRKFIVGPKLSDFMMQGDIYAVYYDANGNADGVFSAELISSAK